MECQSFSTEVKHVGAKTRCFLEGDFATKPGRFISQVCKNSPDFQTFEAAIQMY